MEHIEVKAAFTVGEEGQITGLAWPFGTTDMMGDQIAPGAFAKAAAPLPMLDNHNAGQTVGVWDSVTETGAGLEVKGRLLVNDVARAKEVRALVREKAITGLSIGFIPAKAVARKGGGRTITELSLVEVSIVAIPANPGARIVTAKAAKAGKEGAMPDTDNGAAPDIAALETKMGELSETVKGLDKITERLDGIEAKVNRKGGAKTDADEEPKVVEAKALNTFLRNGVASLDENDRKTLNLGTNTAGGYVVAPEYSTSIIEGITQVSPMRRLASVMSIGTTSILIPTLTTKVTGGWVTETGARPTSEPAFDQIKIDTFEQAVIVPVSQQLLEDSFIDLQAYLSAHIARQFGKQENAAFITGDGNGKPLGLLNTPTDYGTTVAAQDGSDLLDQLIALFYSLPSDYAGSASWVMNRGTMGLIRQTLDTTTKGTLWSDGLANGQPATLMGRPVVEAPDMADFAPTVAADTYPIVFGDIARAYQIVDRIGIQLMRDDYTGADNGIVKIRARRRVGGAPVLPEAIVVMQSNAA